MREESTPKMAQQVSLDRIPSTNDDERIPLPSSSSEEVRELESEAAVCISESNYVAVDYHVERPKTGQENTKEEKNIEESSDLQTSSCLPCKGEMSSTCWEAATEDEYNGRERLKRHRIEMAGRVWIPDIWGQEDLLKDWIDCSAFDACLVPEEIMSARDALVEEGRRAASSGLRIENRGAVEKETQNPLV